MVSRKYAKDYRIEPYLDRSGQLRDRPVYCGDYYLLTNSPEEIRKFFRLLIGLNILTAVTVVLPMFFACEYFKQFYLTLPQAFLLLPVYFLFAGAWRVHTAGEKITREHKDKIANRIPYAGLFLLILSIACAVGSIVYVIVGQPQGADYLALACTAVRLIPAFLIFRMRGTLRIEQIPFRPTDETEHHS